MALTPTDIPSLGTVVLYTVYCVDRQGQSFLQTIIVPLEDVL